MPTWWPVISEILKLIAVLAAVAGWVLSRKAALYAGFDALYQVVLEKGIEKPLFRDPERVRQYKNLPSDDRAAYETYAYMVFNVCETIADGLDIYESRRRSFLEFIETIFCFFLPVMANRKWLRKTWHPVIVAEKELHGSWLRDQTGGMRFKQEFLDLMGRIETVSL